MKQGFDDGLFQEGSGTLADIDLDAGDQADDELEEDDDELEDGWDDDPLREDDQRIS